MEGDRPTGVRHGSRSDRLRPSVRISAMEPSVLIGVLTPAVAFGIWTLRLRTVAAAVRVKALREARADVDARLLATVLIGRGPLMPFSTGSNRRPR
jgi:hypothetical protein